MKTCNRCGQVTVDALYCDQCGKKATESNMVRPRLVSAAVYECGKCGVRLPNSDGASYCSNCGTRFRLMPQCPNGHMLHDFGASFCSECGERIATERLPSLRLAPVERFKILEKPDIPHANAPTRELRQQFQESNGGISSKISEMMGTVRKHLLRPKPKVTIIHAPQYAYPWARPPTPWQNPPTNPRGSSNVPWQNSPQFNQRFIQPPPFSPYMFPNRGFGSFPVNPFYGRPRGFYP